MNLLAMALGATTETQESGRSDVRRGLRESITRYVTENISSPELSASKVAARFRMSTRYLHKLFEDQEQSFSQMTLERRLDRCARDLAKSAQNSGSISQIAFTAGFRDISTFCKAFQRRYGMSASDFRREEPRVVESASGKCASLLYERRSRLADGYTDLSKTFPESS
ncbi:MAG: helix-turn-helix transcriptional regulator [Panacagrimonas sp.]